ncbi:MAG TPA: hypothetical protein VLW85_24135 [Myxococcales bacterium]|nr:hypothetical protein [Myxococcales bacterium]
MLTLALLLLAAAPDVSHTYRVEAPKTVKVKRGEQAQARIEVVPSANAHVSPDAPISLTVKGGPAVTLAKEKLGRAEAHETDKHGVSFDVPFTASSNDKVEGNLTFFICTESLCERQQKQIALAVEVQ